MTEVSTETQPSLEQLQEVLEDPRWEFRTLEGIAQDLALQPEDVAEILADHPEMVRQSILTDHEGQDLYTARSRRPTVRERIERFRSVL